MAISQIEPTDNSRNDQSIDDAFVRLIMQYQRLLFVYLRAALNSASDAEEVLQETYVVLWRKRYQFNLGSNFINWAMTIAQYEARRFRRHHMHLPQVLSDKSLLQLSSKIAADHELIDARQEALVQCLNTLNDRDRNLVNTAYTLNATRKDIGQRVGMTPNGLFKALHRIRQRLLRCIRVRLRTEGWV